MSAALLPMPAFLVTPDSAYERARPEPPVSPGEAQVLAQARAKLQGWRSLDVGARHRLIRNLGIVMAHECGGLSLRQIASAADVSEAMVRKTLKLFVEPNDAQEASAQG